MGVEQRRHRGIPARSTTATAGGSGGPPPRGIRRICATARERIPTIFLLCWAIVAARDLLRLSRDDPSFFLSSSSSSPLVTDDVAPRRQQQRKDDDDRPRARVVVAAAAEEEEEAPNDGGGGVGGFERSGFMVLGMHRSGTSMLTGLLYVAVGYTFGGHLYKGEENAKGFFERFDVVGQNSQFLKEQKMDWNSNVEDFSWEQALRAVESEAVDLKGAKRASRLLFNDPEKSPWLQKDPRMCITLRVWRNLGLLEKEPAIVYTYRHPLEVAQSLHKRSGGRIKMHTGLRLWIVYNMMAIRNSRGMCIVRTSNVALLADPMGELVRISKELTDRCDLPRPKKPVSQKEIDDFLDRDLQHHDAAAGDETKKKKILAVHNDGTCPVYEYHPKEAVVVVEKNPTPEFEMERRRYLAAMRIYCDLESGKAYLEDYEWPDPKDPGEKTTSNAKTTSKAKA